MHIGIMLGISSSARFFICKKPMDMRNGFEGLSSAIEAIFKIDITSDAFFVFTNKSKNRMKILLGYGWHDHMV